MSTLDMRTLFISAAVMALLMGVIVLAFGGQPGPKAPLRSWGWSLLALMTGFTVIGLQESPTYSGRARCSPRRSSPACCLSSAVRGHAWAC